jgi:SNF2 family DNA or RNA helicase
VKYKWRTTPYIHQVEAVRKLLSTGFGGALLMEPRTGKTKTAIDYASILNKAGKVYRVLVVCPNSVLGVWEDEIPRHSPVRPLRITVWDKEGRKEVGLPPVGQNKMDWVLVNYDAFAQPAQIVGYDEDGNALRSKNRGGRFDLMKAIRRWQPDMVILDESHRIKNPDAKRTHTVIRLAWQPHRSAPPTELVPYRVLMTGTAVTKKKRVFDIYAQWQFLNPSRFGHMNFGDFKRYYARWVKAGNIGYDKWVHNYPDKVEELKRELHKDAYSITRAECLDLPDQLPPQIVRVPLTGRAAEAYDQMAEELYAQITEQEVTEASIRLVLDLRLGQLASGIAKTEPTPKYPEGRVVRIGDHKLKVLADLLEDQFEAEEKVVIAAQWIPDVEDAIAMLQKMKVPVFPLYGKVKRSDRDANIKKFRAYDGPAAFVMQPGAGAEGIDLSTAATFYWLSLPTSYVNYRQSEDRVALSPKARRYVYLLGENTVDELRYATLQEDEDLVKYIHQHPDSLLRQ